MAYPAPNAPAPGSTPSMRIQLHISCKDLQKKDVLSKSDPLTIAYTTSEEQGKPVHTEVSNAC